MPFCAGGPNSVPRIRSISYCRHDPLIRDEILTRISHFQHLLGSFDESQHQFAQEPLSRAGRRHFLVVLLPSPNLIPAQNDIF